MTEFSFVRNPRNVNEVTMTKRYHIKVRNIAMGVPITFLDKYNPKQFEIIGLDRYVEDNPNFGHRFHLDKKEVYASILIKRVIK